MKSFIHSTIGALLLFVALTSAVAQASTATVTATFSPNGNPSGTEYFIEQKQGTTFTEVAKGPASPIVFSVANVTVGSTITFRVRARLTTVPNSASGPSNEASSLVPLNAPGSFTVTFVFPPSSTATP